MVTETVETVNSGSSRSRTPLKQGVNEKGEPSSRHDPPDRSVKTAVEEKQQFSQARVRFLSIQRFNVSTF
jgi:hypothetical protein